MKYRLLIFCTSLLLLFFIIHDSQLDLKSAFYLTKNTFKQFKTSDEYPFNNVVNSFFPIDSILEFNTTEGNSTTKIIGRYASFSPVLNSKLSSHYEILPFNMCEKIESTIEYNNKILIVLRGDCTFVDKVTNIIDSNLDPSAIVVANDEPYRSLITMYSNTFNQDGTLEFPIMFITFEDYKILKLYNNIDIIIEISTAYIGSWFSIVLSMVLSPPLLIVLFYCIIVCGQKFRKRQINKRNAQMVKNLPIYIYDNNHLILEQDLDHYLNSTGKFNILNCPNDYFNSYKCSICLEKYHPLKSKVLVLQCKHFFHQNCLSNWLINFKRSCPLCNNTILKSFAGQVIDYGSINDELEEGPEVHDPPPVRNSRPILFSRPSAILNRYNFENEGVELSTSIEE
ncbi:uncharacterized protein KGF55_003566 [Candida pseudojiufengensis]|uniref:uncharacterized protein n=1 Tax=Candida pseudojiufengensis TaxID=497109 RepID=UPI0022252D73|nr:uncharacterized protein KGF55_003566 [Candida pseudojiufengensis]KAI5962490.1 hypothetical protein KGF55_003566 [Candida pseudojiufengensis]